MRAVYYSLSSVRNLRIEQKNKALKLRSEREKKMDRGSGSLDLDGINFISTRESQIDVNAKKFKLS